MTDIIIKEIRTAPHELPYNTLKKVAYEIKPFLPLSQSDIQITELIQKELTTEPITASLIKKGNNLKALANGAKILLEYAPLAGGLIGIGLGAMGIGGLIYYLNKEDKGLKGSPEMSLGNSK